MGLSVLLSVSLLFLIIFSFSLSLPGGRLNVTFKEMRREKTPAGFWLFALAAFLYGNLETMNGNWAILYMKTDQHASATLQSTALTAFWGMVTLGRIIFAFIEKNVSMRWIFQGLPFIIGAAFVWIGLLKANEEASSIFAFALAGLGCSALLPLLISFGSKALKAISESVPGNIIAFYLLGYGTAAFGIGPVKESAQVALSTVYLFGSLLAIALGILSFFIIQNYHEETL